jgi:SAM-dependent methyltransferase
MSPSQPTTEYALGYTDAEHERLVRQAALLSPLTERFFREAGIGPGQRLLDLGSGVGDVAILAARFVGPSGEVVGIERDPRSIAKATVRVAEAGLKNVTFTQSDARQLTGEPLFDGVVGRFILQFLPDPVATLRSLCEVIRPGGIIAFQEPSWSPIVSLARHMPLWTACASLICESMRGSGANHEMGMDVSHAFQQAGLPAPTLQMEIPLADASRSAQWIYDLFCTLLPQMRRLNLDVANVGDLSTLGARIQSEAAASKTPVPCVALVGAWCRKPASPAS